MKDIGIDIDYGDALVVIAGIAIILKFTAFVAMWIALEEYMNL